MVTLGSGLDMFQKLADLIIGGVDVKSYISFLVYLYVLFSALWEQRDFLVLSCQEPVVSCFMISSISAINLKQLLFH